MSHVAHLGAFLAGSIGVLPFLAHARRGAATLVTANVAEFSRVPGLVWEDWAS